MRISSLQIFNVATNSIANTNQALVKTQEQLSSGKRVLRPSDDPVAATKIMALSAELAGVGQYRKNIDIAKNNLAAQESVLGSVNNLVQRIQEIAVQAGNTATLSPAEYTSLASEVDSRLDELVNLLNTQNANGDFIFGGYKSRSEPFVGNADSGFRYVGDDGQQFIKIAHNTTIAASDSGKKIFEDINSSSNTVRTYPSPANRSVPPAQISVGRVVDQTEFDEFFPRDMVITFNADGNIVPPGKNFTATERSSGRVIVANQPYSAGDEIILNGVSFRISGAPLSGSPAVEASRNFGADAPFVFPHDFSGAGQESFQIEVAGRVETLIFDGNITSTTDLANMLRNAGNGNAAKIAALGLVVDNTGIRMPAGVNFRLSGGSANIESVLGLNTLSGSRSTDGVRETPGDRLFIDSTNKQDILTTLVRFSESMKSFDGSTEARSELATTVATTLDNLRNTQTSVLEVVANLGARFNTLESTSSLHQDAELITQKVLAQLQDIDYAEAATRLSSQSLILQAAQSSFIRVSQLSLISQL